MQEYRLSDIVEVIGGGTPKRSNADFWGGSIPWLSVADFNNDSRKVHSSEERITELGLKKSSTKLLDTGQLIISARGTVGALAQLSRPMAFNQSCYGITARQEITKNDFLYYLLKYSVSNFQQVTHGAVFNTITRQTFDLINVQLPPLKEQTQIAEILGALDDKIEVNLKMNKCLEEMAQSLYKEWFVDFDPVIDKARQAGNPIPPELEKNAAKRRHLGPHETPYGLTPATYALFPDSFEDSELGPIPRGWKIKNYFEIAKLLSGGTPKTKVKEYWDGNIKWVSGKDIGGNSACFTLDTEKKVTPLGIEKSAAKILPKHTAIIVARGSVGNLTIIAEEMAMNQSCYGIKAKKDSDQFWLYLGIVKRIADLKQVAYGSVFDTVTTDTFKGLNFIVAPTALMTQFERLINASFTQIEANQKENQALTQTRDTLLPKLISGQVRVNISNLD